MSEWKHGNTTIHANPTNVCIEQEDKHDYELESVYFEYDELPHLISLLQAKVDEKMNDDGWIKHDGSGQPNGLIPGQFEVKYRNGNSGVGRVLDLCWAWVDEDEWEHDILAYRSLETQGIHNLKWLQEFTREAETNPEPWKAFQYHIIGTPVTAWHDFPKSYLDPFYSTDTEFRRKPQKQKVWQWLLSSKYTNFFTLTTKKYANIVDVETEWPGYGSYHIFEESEEEIYLQTGITR